MKNHNSHMNEGPAQIRWFRYMLVACVLPLLVATQITNAAELLRSHPQSGETLTSPLKSIHLWFDELTDASSARVTIVMERQTEVSPDIVGLHAMGDRDLMALVRGDQPDGAYQLRWELDGASGIVPFEIARPDGQVDDHYEPPLDVGIVLYDGAEPLDVFGPLEMWMNLGVDYLRVHLIAERAGPVVLTTTSYPRELAPRIQAHYSFDDAPNLDVLMVPGGVGTLVEVDNPAMIAFLKRAVPEVAVATSVCTGSALYARAGLLEGVEVTGNKLFFDYLVSQGDAVWQPEARWVESGRFFTSSGVSAGIDMSLAVIARFFGMDIARMVAAGAEYVWNEDPAMDPFIDQLNDAVPYVDRMRERFKNASP